MAGSSISRDTMNGSPPPPAYSAVEAEKDRNLMRFSTERSMRFSTWSLGSYYGYYWD